jgi:hypothetical protein
MPTLFGNAARPTLAPLRRFYPLYAPIADGICGETKFKSCFGLAHNSSEYAIYQANYTVHHIQYGRYFFDTQGSVEIGPEGEKPFPQKTGRQILKI